MTSFSRDQQKGQGFSPASQEKLQFPAPSVRTLYQGPDGAIVMRQTAGGIRELGMSRVRGEDMETKYTLIVDQAKDRIVDAFVATKRFPAKDKIPAFLRGLESGELLWTVETSPLARQFKETDRQMARTYAGVLPDGSFFKVTVTPVIGGGGQINLNAVKIDAMQYTSKNGICQPIWMNTEFSTQGQMLFGKVCPTTPGKFTAEDFLQIKRRMGDSSPLPETEEVSASKSLLRIAQAILAA